MNRRELWLLAGRVLLAWGALSVLGMLYGEQLLAPVLPLLSVITDLISPQYFASLSIITQEGDKVIHLSATVSEPLRVHGDTYLGAGAHMTAGIHLYHALVPIVILYTALFAWPLARIRHRLELLVIGLALSIGVLGITVPSLLASHIEALLADKAAAAGASRDASLLVSWSMFAETGGRWLIPLVAAGVGYMLLGKWTARPVGQAARHPRSQAGAGALHSGVPRKLTDIGTRKTP